MTRYSRRNVAALLHDSDNALTADEKGEKLEQLGRYLFEKMPGVSLYAKNILDGNRAHELDLAFFNMQNQSPVCFLDPSIIVECKNTKNPVTSADVGWFVRKLQDRGANYGILIALSGITGANDRESAAYSEVLSALIRDRIKILIITRGEILALTTVAELVDLLKEKYMRLVLYKTVI